VSSNQEIMMSAFDRRQFLELAGVGGAVFVSGLSGVARGADAAAARSLSCADVFCASGHEDMNGTLIVT
jgi:hypothetical protein